MAQEYDIFVTPQRNDKSSGITINPYLKPCSRLGTVHTNCNKWRVTAKRGLTAKSSMICANFLSAFIQTSFKSQNLCMRYSGCTYEVVERKVF